MTKEIIYEPEHLKSVFSKMKEDKGVIGWDTETYGPTTHWKRDKKDQLFPYELTAKAACMTFSFADEDYYIPINNLGKNLPKETWFKFLKAFFNLPNPHVAHKLPFDTRIVYNDYGSYLWAPNYHCSLKLAWITASGQPYFDHNGEERFELGLKGLSEHILGHKMIEFLDVVGKKQVVLEGISNEELEKQMKIFTAQHLDGTGVITKGKRALVNCHFNELTKGRITRTAQSCDYTAEELVDYACDDSRVAKILTEEHFLPKLKEMGLEDYYYKSERTLIQAERHMTDVGVPISVEGIQDIRKKIWPVMESLAAEFKELVAVDINSSKDCVKALYHDGLFPVEGPPRTEKGALSLDKKAIGWIKYFSEEGSKQRKVCEIMLEHKTLKTTYGSFTNSLIAECPFSPDGRVHPFTNFHGPRTGRASTSQPNSSQFPSKPHALFDLRSLVYAPEGYIMGYLDFKQAEIVIMAYYSQDKTLLELVNSGESMHDRVAKLLDIPRSDAKCVSGGTPIMVDDEFITMEELARSSNAVVQGATALARHRIGTNAQSIGVYCDGESIPLCVLTTKGALVCSPKHKILAQNKFRARQTMGTVFEYWCEAQALKPGQVTITPEFSAIEWADTDNQAYLAGAMWARLLETDIEDKAQSYTNFLNRLWEHWENTTSENYDQKKPWPFETKLQRFMQQCMDAALEYEVFDDEIDRLPGVPIGILNAGRKSAFLFAEGVRAVSEKKAAGFRRTKFTRIQDLIDYTYLLRATEGLDSYEVQARDNHFLVSQKHGYYTKICQVLNVFPVQREKLYDIQVADESHAYQASIFSTHNTIVFALQYGGGPVTAARSLKLPITEEYSPFHGKEISKAPAHITEFVKKIKKEFPGIEAYRKSMAQKCREQGYVETIHGFRRYFSDITSPNDSARSAAERSAANHPIQGSVATIMRAATAAVYEDWFRRGYKGQIIANVHDALLVLFVKDGTEQAEAANVTRIMESQVDLGLPLKVECKLGSNWSACA